MSDTCRDCGETLQGDGYTTPIHCPYALEELLEGLEPDAEPVHCECIGDIWEIL